MSMERARLEALSLEELRQEALRYQLPVTASSDKNLLIEVIMSHLEQNSPFEEMMPPAQRSRAPSGARSGKGSGQADLPGLSTMSPPAGEAPGALEQIAVTLGIFLEQQRRMMDEVRTFVQRGSPAPDEAPRPREREEAVRPPAISASSPAQAVSLLASQIPEYGGTDEENVQIWTQRVDRVAQIHRASDDVVLLAASGKLTKLAKQWYEMQNGNVLESWADLKRALVQMFDRRISFTAAMQKIETRKWSPAKETFDQYSIEKLALIHRLNLPTADTISLLIGGIPQHSLRATALTLPTHSLDQFLEAMRRITFGMGDFEKKSAPQQPKNGRSKDNGYRGSDGKQQGQRDGKATEGVCNYCKKKGYWKADCQLLKKKEKTTATATSSPSTSKATTSSNPTAAAVAEIDSDKFHITGPLIKIDSINNISCNLNALMDTGSPVSFIGLDNFNKMFDFSDLDVLIGRDFLEDHDLTLIFRPAKSDAKSFTQLLLETDVCYTDVTPESIVEECEIDFGPNEKQRLKDVVSQCLNACVDFVDDDYFVTVHLKDDSPYAYAPRKFALKEREQIREITDDLLTRGIIKRNLKDGFHQIKVHPDHTKYFAFATPDGQFEMDEAVRISEIAPFKMAAGGPCGIFHPEFGPTIV
ncbi:hypothetical protein RF55_11226 [Lasius niger]|uniref:Uncharacterized protein n=1 Tax=Lasius niger TaxID=67767 RepID=A0A0J7KFW0_LASNI|nr:hypothetical protein RF55_11226 [Lasius niger]